MLMHISNCRYINKCSHLRKIVSDTNGCRQCRGSERSLALCLFQRFGQENCDHREDEMLWMIFKLFFFIYINYKLPVKNMLHWVYVQFTVFTFIFIQIYCIVSLLKVNKFIILKMRLCITGILYIQYLFCEIKLLIFQ